MSAANMAPAGIRFIVRALLPLVIGSVCGAYQLPETVEPIHYDLLLMPNLSDQTFEGELYIDMRVVHPTTSIILYATDLQIKMASLDWEVVQVAYQKENHVLEFTPKTALQAGKSIRLQILYSGKISDDGKGFYRTAYSSEGDDIWVGASRLSATLARRVFPCLDEPWYRATFTLSIMHDYKFGAVSNTKRVSIGDPDPSYEWRVRTVFAQTPPLPCSALAWVLSKLPHYSSGASNFSTHARPEVRDELVTMEILGPRVLEVIKDYTKVPLNVEKMDVVALPVLPEKAADANLGLMIQRESLVVTSKESLASAHIQVETSTARSLARQWFGSFISPAKWSDAWVAEGLSSLLGYHAVDKLNPGWTIMSKMPALELQEAFTEDDYEGFLALNRDLSAPEDILNQYGPLMYSKGVSILRMLEHAVTTQTFQKALTKFLQEMRGPGTYQLENLLSRIVEAANEDGTDSALSVSEFEVVAKTWTDQPGFPEVIVERDYVTNSMTVSQNCFPSAAASTCTRSWWIPISWTHASQYTIDQTKPKIWLPSYISISVGTNLLSVEEWVIVNLRQTGYYRVNYDTKNWLLLADELQRASSVLTEADRAMLFDDALSLARAGRLEYSVALQLTKSLRVERTLAPWTAAARGLRHLAMFFRGSKYEETYNGWVRSLVSNAYTELGFSNADDQDSPDRKAVRGIVARLACEAGLASCTSDAQLAFSRWISGQTVDATTLSAAICVGANTSSSENFKKVLGRLMSAERELERADIISGLGCSTRANKERLLRVFAVASNPLIPIGEVRMIWSSVGSTAAGVSLALSLVNEMHALILESYGREHLITILNTLGRLIVSEDDRDKLNAVIQLNPTLGSDAKYAPKRAQENLRWKQRNLQVVLDYMEEVQETPPPSLSSSTFSPSSTEPRPTNPPTRAPTIPTTQRTVLPSPPTTPSSSPTIPETETKEPPTTITSTTSRGKSLETMCLWTLVLPALAMAGGI